mgnify:CR=1 FL=1
MATLFIADLHLCVEEPAITAGFLRFLAGEARNADALYILGDLFEAWIGDDDPNPLHRQMAAAIKAVSDSGVPCYFIHGNRDFLLGKRFARESGMTLLPEEKVLELYGRRVLIMHGDTLCTDDAGYQAFRAKVHKPWLQTLLTILGTILASSGFWAYIQERSKRKAAENKHNNLETQMLIGLAHDRIIYLGMAYIERGYITQDEYENLYEYLYKPYEKLGGNGSAKRIMTEVDQLAIHKSTYNA